MSADAVARSRHRHPSRPSRLRRRLWYTLLLVEFVAVLIPSLYAREDPKAWGIPFFYWYQFAWIIGSAILTAIVYWATSTEASRARRAGGDLR